MPNSGVFCNRWNNHGHVYENLEWRGSQNQEQAADERRMIVAVQEVGNAERQDERIVQGYTVKIKIPREQDDL